MTDNPDRPGFNDLVTPFIFVKHGDPDPVEWKRANPGWVSFPATFIPHKKPTPKWAIINGRRWPLDKRGQPWPRSRFGQPLCPLDEFPPGVPAPGTQGRAQEEQEAAIQRGAEAFLRGETSVEWFLAEGARARAEREAREAANPSPPPPPSAYTYDPAAPSRAYMAQRASEADKLQEVGADPDGRGSIRGYVTATRGADTFIRNYADGARQRNAARLAASGVGSVGIEDQLAAADGGAGSLPTPPGATSAPGKDEQRRSAAPSAVGRGPILSDSDGPATHLPDGTPLVRVADKRTYYGPDALILPNTPSNQAFVRDTGRAIKTLRDGPGFTPTPPLPPPAPFPVTPSQPSIEALPADEGASRPGILSTPQAPALPTVTAGDEFDPQQVIIMEAQRNNGLDPELRSYSERARRILREDPSIGRAGLTDGEWRAHHLIPHEAVRRNVELFQAAAKAGYRIDNPGNLVALPVNEVAQEKLRQVGEHRPIHDNPHKDWNAARLLETEKTNDDLATSGYLQGSEYYNARAKFLLEEWESKLRVLLPSQRRLTLYQPDGTDTEGIG